MLLLFGQQVFNLLIAHLNHEVCDRITHTLLVEREGERLLNAVIDNEEKGFLENSSQGRTNPIDYVEKKPNFHNSINHLYNLVQDKPDQIKQLDKIRYIYNQLQIELKQKALSVSVSNSALAKSTLFDSLDNEIEKLIQREEMLLRVRKNHVRDLNDLNTAINIFSTLTILLGAVLNLQLLHRRVKLPLDKLTQVSKLWQAGQMEVQLYHSSKDEIGQLAGVLNAIADKTRHRQQSIEVRNQQLENMISALSHDLRIPLLATRNTLDCMSRGAFGPVNDTWKEVFEEYYEANEDLLKLVELLLDISRYEAHSTCLACDCLNWEKILIKVIGKVKATSAPELAFICKISRLLPTVYGDELEIQRVLQNLLDNAVRVSKPKGEILLEITPYREGQVQISVRDYGSGIAPQAQEKLFHRFIQGRGHCGRSGLGLYLCRQIIEAHGGNIGVESSLGEGSTFWFTLPSAINNVDCNYEQNITRCSK
ncbi:ATP-binding protein [Nostoc sp. LEGE 12450]|uniref:ATP-binding protein n=1 Tax=Nostoc sp. LEGE 12450 TaxID=1828643 RepID=UPI00188125B2|nr:ATP-binding protein [Nostoc sp. LEGE 12450]MBE8991531.1 HAMP domain-containing histidine kinase [Nostoc sp. LEGE 12450]